MHREIEKFVKDCLQNMKEKNMIMLVGSSQYLDKMIKHKQELEKAGFEVKLPASDEDFDNELKLIKYHRELIRSATQVHVFWDQRSLGTFFDLGMAFGLNKRIKFIYLESKTPIKALKRYAEEELR